MTLAQIRNTKVVELLSTVIDNLVQGQLNTCDWLYEDSPAMFEIAHTFFISCFMAVGHSQFLAFM